MYIPESCPTCDSLVSDLDKSPYLYTSYRFSEKPELKSQLAPSFSNATVKMDSIQTPIISSGGGVLYLTIENYDDLMEEFNKN